MNKRKIAVITGSRAEYGLLYCVIKMIHDDPNLELQLIVTGSHLSERFGLTIREIETDSFPIAEKIEMLIPSESEESIATSMGVGMMGFAKAYARLRPDIIVVLGDRFEIYAAVSAAVPFRIPIAHIHGGEATEGAFDEQLRHAITKISHIHFPSTPRYKKRIIQLGENPKNIFCFGAPGIDNILELKLLTRKKLSEELDIPKNKKIGVMTYHSVTLEYNTVKSQVAELLQALRKVRGVFWTFTLTNPDTGSRVIISQMENFVKNFPEISRLCMFLGRKKYLSLLKHAAVMVGNSSSGLIEAPSFELPVVNIGDRQKGRIRTANVIDVTECKKQAIFNAIKEAMSPGFRKKLEGLKNPYGDGNTSEKIVKILKEIELGEKLIKKEFYVF